MQPLILTPTDFVATTNQILETSFGFFYVEGELSQFRISKNKWVYFDIKDEFAKVSFFGSIYMLPGPLVDGMVVRVGGSARLHPQYGFSITAQSIQPVGQGSLHQALALLTAKLEKEGLFNVDRKRILPTRPIHIALVASVESAAYADFIKIANVRWPFVTVTVYDTLVQGENAPEQLVQALHEANSASEVPDVIVMTRGGGSADDLAAFNDERVVRAVAACRVPTLVAIGHEIDESLAERAADVRASTPSNAAELLLPDKAHELAVLYSKRKQLSQVASSLTALQQATLRILRQQLERECVEIFANHREQLRVKKQLLMSYNPSSVLGRGYAIVRSGNEVIVASKVASGKKHLTIQFSDGTVDATPMNKV